MVQLIVGPKGSGKTGKLVDELNQLVLKIKMLYVFNPVSV